MTAVPSSDGAAPLADAGAIRRLMLFFGIVYVVEGLGQTGGLIAQPLTYFLKELSYFLKDSLDAVPDKKTDAKTVDLDISDLTVPLDAKGYKWRCELTIQAKNSEEKHFYDFKIVMIGFFAVDSKVEPERAKLIAETNAPAVLYSTSRAELAPQEDQGVIISQVTTSPNSSLAQTQLYSNQVNRFFMNFKETGATFQIDGVCRE